MSVEEVLAGAAEENRRLRETIVPADGWCGVCRSRETLRTKNPDGTWDAVCANCRCVSGHGWTEDGAVADLRENQASVDEWHRGYYLAMLASGQFRLRGQRYRGYVNQDRLVWSAS